MGSVPEPLCGHFKLFEAREFSDSEVFSALWRPELSSFKDKASGRTRVNGTNEKLLSLDNSGSFLWALKKK